MKDHSIPLTNLPPEQQAIRAKCSHPTGRFEKFPIEDVEKSIPDRFEKIVRRYPDRIAVKARDQAVTYAELNAMANRLARTISERSSTIAEPVGVLVDQGVSLMAVMLGVLKAGKFFVLLDPALPKSRIAAMLQDSRAPLVICDRENARLIAAVANDHRRLIAFEEVDSRLAANNLGLHLPPTSLASISYTSGSTGQPKGVMQNQRNLLHEVMLYTNILHVCRQDNIGLLPAGAPIVAENTLLALLNGAVLLPFDVQKKGAAALGQWLLDEKISFCWIISSLLRGVCDALGPDRKLPDLRAVRVTAEVYKTDIDLFTRNLSPDCVIVRGFASSEAYLLRTFLIDHRTKIAGTEVPVGYAVEDKDILLRDDKGDEVGFNEIGEIAVRSRYLSPGYWRNPDLTQAKFKPAPTGGEERVYLSGDLGLMLPDGCLMFKGRKDFQVKIRGYNASLVEIEGTLLAHPRIKEAGVVAWERNGRDKSLAAYVVPRRAPAPTVGDLRSFLREKLPEYMIPSAFIFLDALPLINGKLDRNALPQPDDQRPELSTSYASPQNEIERTLVQILEEALDVHPIGIHDDFFELGGHSLQAMRVIARIKTCFQVDVSLRIFLEAPTTKGLADLIEVLRSMPVNLELLPKDPASGEETGEL